MNYNRPNKNALGFTLHLEARRKKGKDYISNPKHPAYNDATCRKMGMLGVYGSFDSLANRKGLSYSLSKKVMKEHPIDKGYFKEVYIISSYGKRLLKNKTNI